ncbi:MAG: MarR family transcriptional regulator [Melioribacteraceae bacterium]|nr:MarR family transcriptional regulator [Melioribacteraceae bacterium]
MNSESKAEIKSPAEIMSELTCELGRTCTNKEHFFAAKFDLTPAEFRCLRLFKDCSSMSIKRIAVQMNLTPGRITHILTSLEAKNYIVRKVDQKDKRNIIVHLTKSSKPFLKIVNENHIKLHENILNNISENKRVFMLESMEELIKSLKTWTDNTRRR